MLLAFKSKLNSNKSVVWKDRFDQTVAQGQAILNEKKPFFIDKTLDEVKLSTVISQDELEKILKSSIGSTINYIENDYYAQTDEAKRAIFAAPPFEGPELNALYESLKNTSQDEKLKSYIKFYLQQFSAQMATQVIRSSYGYNPGLVIQIKDKLVKKPGGLRNQMANDIVDRLIKVDARFGGRKQFEYVDNSIQSAVAGAQAAILQTQENDGGQEDIDQIYQSQIDTIDLRMLHFLNTPEQKSLWQLCVALDNVAGIMKNDVSTQAFADMVYTFVDQNLVIRPSSFQEQRAQLILLINKIKETQGLDADHQYSVVFPLETLLKEKLKIPAGEQELKALFILSKIRATFVEYHAVKKAKYDAQCASPSSSSTQNTSSRRSSLFSSVQKNFNEIKRGDKMPLIDDAIKWVDDRIFKLRNGEMSGKCLLETLSDRKQNMDEIMNIHLFIDHVSAALKINSKLGSKLNMTFEHAEREWHITQTLLHYSSWSQIQAIETVVAKVTHENFPTDDDDLIAAIARLVQNEVDLREFTTRIHATFVFRHYEKMMTQALQHYVKAGSDVHEYGIMSVMVEALKQMIAFSKSGISHQSTKEGIVDTVLVLHQRVTDLMNKAGDLAYPSLQSDLITMAYTLKPNARGNQPVFPRYKEDFLPLQDRLSVFKPRSPRKVL